MKIASRILFVLLFTLSISAQKQFSVLVDVKGDRNLAENLSSHINREIRSLGDVRISDNGELGIWVVVEHDISKTGESLGFSASAVFTEKIICKGKVYDNYLSVVLLNGSASDLPKIAETIVTRFDVKVLSKKRK